MSMYIYIGAAFLAGLILAWLIRMSPIAKLKKENKSLKGLLESERLMRENMQKENSFLLQSADASILTTKEELRKALALIKTMDSDILLLQKSNEETEDLLAKGEPALDELRLKLIEANNTIARLKAQYGK